MCIEFIVIFARLPSGNPAHAAEAQMAESVDALVSNTNGDDPCRFDPGSGYNKSPVNKIFTGDFTFQERIKGGTL